MRASLSWTCLLLLACSASGTASGRDPAPEPDAGTDAPDVTDGGAPPATDDAGLVPPTEDAGFVPPMEDGGFAPPMEDAGFAPPMEDAGFDAGADDNGAPPGYGPVDGLELSGLEMYQSIRVPLVVNGAPATRTIPLLANKPSLLRVFVRPTGAWSPQTVMALVRFETRDGERTFRTEAMVSGASVVETAATTLNVLVPRDVLTPETSVSVRLLAPGGRGAEATTRYPRDGSQLDLQLLTNGTLDVVVVPIRYNADGSGRMPDVSDAALEDLRNHFLALWPVVDVRIRLRAPVSTNSTLPPSSGQAWSNLLSGIGNLRQTDGAPADEYYVGLIAPTATYAEFCSRGCIAGMAPLNSRNAASQRYGVAVGYNTEASRYTAIHELAHSMGRAHAPCGNPAGVDPAFPHAGGAIGVWGFDFRNRTLIRPNTADFMGYCNPQWVSDYTYRAMRERVVAVTGSRTLSGRALPHHLFQLGPFQAPRWAGVLDEEPAESGEDEQVVMVRARDAYGRSLGWVAARQVELSVAGYANLLVPEIEGAVRYETTSGGILEIRERESVLVH
ncbi:MAG: hypothetical protein KF901_02350 [Myxococcales bacterium]|nr:hypothetical protein [Myxococcales bacterium]